MTNALSTGSLPGRYSTAPLQPRRDRVRAIYRKAVFALDARRTPGTSAAGNTIQDLSANALRTQSGTTGNAKIVQDGSGGKALRLHGTTTGYASTPDSAAVSVTGDLDLRCHARLDDWTPAAAGTFICKAEFSTTYSYVLGIDATTGVLRLIVSPDGSTLTGVTSSVAPTVTDGESLWVRVTWRASDGRVQFFTSADGTSWTQLGTDRTAAIGSLFNGTQPLWVGVRQAGPANGLTGLIHRAQVYDGIDGTLVADFDPSRDASYSSLSWASSTTGETWTVTPGGADNSDPLLLPAPSEYGATRYVYLPGGTGNYLSTPDAAALDITGDIDLRVHCAMDDWTASTNQHLIGKWRTSDGNRSWRLILGTTGELSLQISSDGSATGPPVYASFASTSAVPFADGAAGWVRVTLDADNGAGGADIKFYTSTDGVTWTQLGTTRTHGSTWTTFSGTAVLSIGARVSAEGDHATGRFFRAQVYDGIDGVKVFDWSAEDTVTATHSAFTASTGQTVTVNRATAGRKTAVVEQRKWLLGTDDYIEVADNALLDLDAATDFTVLAVVRQHATPTNYGRWVTKKDSAGTTAGWILSSDATKLAPLSEVDDGPDVAGRYEGAGTSLFTAGALNALGFVVNRTSATLAVHQNGSLGATTSVATVGDASTAVAMRVGANASTVGQYQDFELYAVYIWREALSASELAAIAADWGAA